MYSAACTTAYSALAFQSRTNRVYSSGGLIVIKQCGVLGSERGYCLLFIKTNLWCNSLRRPGGKKRKERKKKEPIMLWTRSNQIRRWREQLKREDTGVLCYCTRRGAPVKWVAAGKMLYFEEGRGKKPDNIAIETQLKHQQLWGRFTP